MKLITTLGFAMLNGYFYYLGGNWISMFACGFCSAGVLIILMDLEL